MRLHDVLFIHVLVELHLGKGLGDTDDSLELSHGDWDVMLFLARKLVLFGSLTILDIEVR